jgi:hypothetical protein
MNSFSFITDLKGTRGEAWDFLVNYLGNFGRSARLMHRVLATLREDKAVCQEAMRGYIIAMASCLETFYRDLYVYVLSQDEVSLRRVLADVRDKATLVEIHSLLADGLTFSEIVTSKATFQSISEIDSFVSKLFHPAGYLDTLQDYEHICLVPLRGAREAHFKLDDKWRSNLANLFTSRHALVHDANKSFHLSVTEMASLETTALLVPQLTAELVSKKFDGKGTLRIRELPVLILVDDLLSDDWEIADEEGIRLQGRAE